MLLLLGNNKPFQQHQAALQQQSIMLAQLRQDTAWRLGIVTGTAELCDSQASTLPLPDLPCVEDLTGIVTGTAELCDSQASALPLPDLPCVGRI